MDNYRLVRNGRALTLAGAASAAQGLYYFGAIDPAVFHNRDCLVGTEFLTDHTILFGGPGQAQGFIDPRRADSDEAFLFQ